MRINPATSGPGVSTLEKEKNLGRISQIIGPVAPVLSTLWFGSLAGLLIEINRLFPDALTFPFFSF